MTTRISGKTPIIESKSVSAQWRELMRTFRNCNTYVLAYMVGLVFCAAAAAQQLPDHPIITEVYNNPSGANDASLGHDPANEHQEFIEIYIPPLADLDSSLLPFKDALRLTFYEVEGDSSSSGLGLVNYRFDLPAFDLDPDNGITAMERPPSGIVVIGWIDYTNNNAGTCDNKAISCSVFAQDCGIDNTCEANPPTGLAGTPTSRIALINGGITDTGGEYLFFAMNGRHFVGDEPPTGGGTTNFPNLDAENFVDFACGPTGSCEARSGTIQNGSAVYLLVNRDDGDYVELCDDKHAEDCDSGADPVLPDDSFGLHSNALLDGFAANDDFAFDIDEQPYDPPTGLDIDLETVLPKDGAFSNLVAQIPEELDHGYARLNGSIAKTTEDNDSGNDDPVEDAMEAYRTTSNEGPFFASPGRAPFVDSAAELGVATPVKQFFEVLAGTTGRPGLRCANIGGSGLVATATLTGSSSNPAVATFAAADSDTTETPSSRVNPSIAATVPNSAVHGASASVTVDVSAQKLDPGDPNVINPSGSTTATMIVIRPTKGQDEFGSPFQATVFAAVQAIPQQAGVNNEFLGTSLATFVFENLEGIVEDEFSNGVDLLNPTTDLSNGIVVDGLKEDMPDFPEEFINVPAPAGTDDLVTTILNSAEVLSGESTYDDNFDELPPPDGAPSAVRAIDIPLHTLLTSGGAFVPTERIHYTNAAGRPGLEDSGLTNVTTTHGFELALIDTNVSILGNIETGATDDFGLIVEAGETEPDSPVQTGEFIFLSLTGGKEGADVDSLDVPPHGQHMNIIYVDLDPLDFELGVKTITRLLVIDGSGNGTVNLLEVFTLNVDQAACTSPSIFSQPTSQSACDGGSASFSVGATGTPPLQYQWRKGIADLENGGNISGATTAILTIDPVSPSDVADYSVTVANACGEPIPSATATLTIGAALEIIEQPVSQTVCANGFATFTVSAAGTPPLSYQWFKNGGAIPGATSSSLIINPVSPGDTGSYDVVVSNPCGSIPSNSATLTVDTAPTITVQPVPQSVCVDGAAVFTVIADGAPSPTYQWRRNGVEIPDETAPTLVISPVSPGDAGSYDAVASNTCGSVISNAATLTVSTEPTITMQPVAQQACEGGVASFMVAASGTGVLTYQWFVDAEEIFGETSSFLMIDPVGPADAGTYHADVTDDCGTVSSTGAALTVIDCGDCPPPAVAAEGARYIAITPVAGPDPVALFVTSETDLVCLSLYVDFDPDPALQALGIARFVDTPVFRTPAEWGTVHVGDAEVLPETTYEAAADCGGAMVSVSIPTTTWIFGDVNNSGPPVDFDDIICVLDGFAGGGLCSLYNNDLVGVVPSGTIDFDDILATLEAFAGSSLDIPDPCGG